jgi:coproporphyrinogen III oxidase
MEALRIVPDTGRKKTIPAPAQKEQAALWFAQLRDMICAALESIEQEYAQERGGVAGAFARKNWARQTNDGSDGGGGTMSLLRGQVFEKAGVNISTVHGRFSKEFRRQIPGAEENNGAFWASGVSLVLHPASPLVPIVHMNTRYIVTSSGWFGGGADLTPVFPVAGDTARFHARLQSACDAHDASFYPRYRKWCDEYFYIPHRQEPRGVGGIFYDNHDSGDWNADFAFTRDVGLAFLDIYPQIARTHIWKPWGEAEREAQLLKRGRYVEFNLAHDRGTRFGLMTGGNPEAVLMSLPPEAKWP